MGKTSKRKRKYRQRKRTKKMRGGEGGDMMMASAGVAPHNLINPHHQNLSHQVPAKQKQLKAAEAKAAAKAEAEAEAAAEKKTAAAKAKAAAKAEAAAKKEAEAKAEAAAEKEAAVKTALEVETTRAVKTALAIESAKNETALKYRQTNQISHGLRVFDVLILMFNTLITGTINQDELERQVEQKVLLYILYIVITGIIEPGETNDNLLRIEKEYWMDVVEGLKNNEELNSESIGKRDEIIKLQLKKPNFKETSKVIENFKRVTEFIHVYMENQVSNIQELVILLTNVGNLAEDIMGGIPILGPFLSWIEALKSSLAVAKSSLAIAKSVSDITSSPPQKLSDYYPQNSQDAEQGNDDILSLPPPAGDEAEEEEEGARGGRRRLRGHGGSSTTKKRRIKRRKTSTRKTSTRKTSTRKTSTRRNRKRNRK